MSSKQKGFTLVELLVVIVIITVISGIVVVNFRKGEGGNKLQRSAQLIVQSIRKAQNMALSSLEVGNDIYDYYGVHFDKNTLPDSFCIFASDNKPWNPGDPIQVGSNIELEDGVVIDSLSTGVKLNIVFKPPYSFVEFNPTTDEATITIKKQGGVCPQDCRYIKINNTGWMSISKTP